MLTELPTQSLAHTFCRQATG